MTDRQALLRAIVEDPEDDAPRLVYADWLDENGDPDRAEFIRLQCQRPHAYLDSHRPLEEIHDRASYLLARNEQRWRSELPSYRGVTWVHFERGFVAVVYVENSARLQGVWRAIIQAAPISALVTSVRNPQELRDFANRAELQRIRWLGLSGAMGDLGAAILASSPNLANACQLTLQSAEPFTDRAAELFLRSTCLPRLDHLWFLDGSRITDQMRSRLKLRFKSVRA